MATLVHILSRADDSIQNAKFPYKYWTPVIVHKMRITAKHNVRIEFFYEINNRLPKCDIIIIENKYFTLISDTNEHRIRFDRLADLLSLRISKGVKIIWFDAWDSASMIDSFAIEHVDRYLKMQAFKDLDAYRNKCIFSRSYVDFYIKSQYNSQFMKLHNQAEPILSRELVNELDSKLRLSWNFGYSFQYSSFDCNELMKNVGSQWWTPEFVTPKRKRPIDLQARFLSSSRKKGLRDWWLTLLSRPFIDNYIQRELIHSRLSKIGGLSIARGRLLSKALFMEELGRVKAAISPFGHGEICYRDFETIISGALLIKPDMNHLKTWPNLFEDGKTCITFKWDLSDLEERILFAISQDDYRIAIAEMAQDEYLQFWSQTVDDGFVDYFYNLLQF